VGVVDDDALHAFGVRADREPRIGQPAGLRAALHAADEPLAVVERRQLGEPERERARIALLDVLAGQEDVEVDVRGRPVDLEQAADRERLLDVRLDPSVDRGGDRRGPLGEQVVAAPVDLARAEVRRKRRGDEQARGDGCCRGGWTEPGYAARLAAARHRVRAVNDLRRSTARTAPC
jgi:hypothetical protein